MAHTVAVRNGMTSSDEKALSNLAVAFTTSGGGVVAANDYLIQAQGSPNNTILVNTGRAYVPTSDGSMVYSTRLDATQNVTIAANATGSTQIDSVVLYIDLSASPDATATNVAKFADVRGTAGVAPTNAQILTAIGASNPYIILANVSCANGFTSINSGNITDKRAFAKVAGGDTVFQSALGNFVSSGLTIPTSASLTTTMAAGVLYYNGLSVSVATDSGHAYTASNDAYVDVSNTGAVTYNTVANGGTPPALTANSIRIAKVVTSGTAVTTLTQSGFDTNGVAIYPTSPLSKFALGGDAQGDVYYRNAQGFFQRLGPGTSGQFLQTQGAAANPQWAGVGAQDKTTTAVVISNSSAETTIYTYSVPGNTLGTSKWLRLALWGQAFNNTGGNVNFTIRVKYGATTLATGTRAFGTVNATVPWMTNAYLAADGGAAAQKAGFFFSGQEGTNGGNYFNSGYGTATEDSTATKTFSVTVQLASASASATFTMQSALLELIA